MVTKEKPTTNEADAAAQWCKARSAFLKQKKAVDAELAAIEGMRRDIQALKETISELQRLDELRPRFDQAVANARKTGEARRQEHATATAQAERDKTMLDSHLAGRFGFFARLFGTASWKAWSASEQRLAGRLRQSVQRARRPAMPSKQHAPIGARPKVNSSSLI